MENIKEEDSFFEEESPEETLTPERIKPNGGPWFTFDDIPPNRWRKRLLEFGAWLDTQMMKTSAEKTDKNSLRWCYSLKTKDLDRHYHRMAQRYYVLNGYNDPSLKNTYVSSLPQELQPEIHRMLATTQRDIKTMSLGQIHQVTIEALEKLYSFHHQFSEVIEQKSKFTHACRKPYLEIKCNDKRNDFFLQDSSPDEALSSESEDGRYLPIYSFKEIGSSLPTPPLPCVEVHVLGTKFSRPKKVIAYMDTGVRITMMNPGILPAESWVTHVSYFVAEDGKVLKTYLMTKEKIGIKFFPDCIV
ncbi:hypothetical protein KIW84_065296 [Lathyrus oleraceus]|uniref:Uncharacterized protein n=1 Tax=Pisum sativum TaxID=3888 RepID=A0A9D4WF15_PEA|nr:hypothetical protein KIW84_065296 [Pisum sativum]